MSERAYVPVRCVSGHDDLLPDRTATVAGSRERRFLVFAVIAGIP